MKTYDYYYTAKATVTAKSKEEADQIISDQPELFLDNMDFDDMEPTPSIEEQMDDDS